ncbi:unnamed protein product [Clonostachys rosea f. rosea IK726]|uniref:Uncharacterized protein n=1 Tax=Clonostachys rosea f. rosea IK726 TaxID=1349383 RepID=A0ACA9UE55_BIOOC|nr:unnamed protein product [Clonostachys rosea f. rosea IK726]
MVRLSTLFSVVAALTTCQAVRFLGRVDPEKRELTWPGTGVLFTFTGTSASVAFTSVSGDNSVEVVVDDGIPTIIDNVSGTSIDTPTLEQGQHTVNIRKRSEAGFGTLTVGEVAVTGGKLGCATVPGKRIQIIGDSITVGYGLDGTFPCTNTAALENAPKTYGALTAKNISAEYDIIAWSGIGLTRNYMGSDDYPNMSQRWTRYGAHDADNSYTFPESDTPDIVVINLGTNDFSYLGVRDPLNVETFTEAMVEFVQVVQGHYPKAELFLTSSPMLGDSWPEGDLQHTTHANAVKSVVDKIGNKVHFVEFPSQGSVVACDYHPVAEEHEKMAVILTSAIQSVINV